MIQACHMIYDKTCSYVLSVEIPVFINEWYNRYRILVPYMEVSTSFIHIVDIYIYKH
jgi:hypothetical protein